MKDRIYNLLYESPLSFLLPKRKRDQISRKKAFDTYNFEALCKVKEVCESLGISYWLDFGTLLGIYRDGDFIPHDDDIDLGILASDYSDKFDKAMLDAGFQKKYDFLVDDGAFARENTYSYKGMGVDIFCHYEKNGLLCTHEYDAKVGHSFKSMIETFGGLLVREIQFPDTGLGELTFRDHTFGVPQDIKRYLSSHYGDDFMTPQSGWRSIDHAPNIVEINDKMAEMRVYH